MTTKKADLMYHLPSNIKALTFENEDSFAINAALYMATLVYFRPGIADLIGDNYKDGITHNPIDDPDFNGKFTTLMGNISDFLGYFDVPVIELYNKMASQYDRDVNMKSASKLELNSFTLLANLVSEAHADNAGEYEAYKASGETACHWVSAVAYHSGKFVDMLRQAMNDDRLYHFSGVKGILLNTDRSLETVRKSWGKMMSSDDMRQKYIDKYANKAYFFTDSQRSWYCTVGLTEIEGRNGWYWLINTGVSELVFNLDFSDLTWDMIATQLVSSDKDILYAKSVRSGMGTVLQLLLYPNFAILASSLIEAASDKGVKINDEELLGKKAIASIKREENAKKKAEAEEKARLEAEKKAEAERKKQGEYEAKHSVVEAPFDILEYGIATFSATDKKWGRTKKAFKSWYKTATPSDIWGKWSDSLLAGRKDLTAISLDDYFNIWDVEAYYGRLKDEPSMSKLLIEYKKAFKDLGYKVDPNSKEFQNMVVDALEHYKVIHSWSKYKQTYHFDKSFPRDTKVDFKTLALLPYSSFCVEIDGQYYFVYLDNYEWDGALPSKGVLGVDMSSKAINGYAKRWLDRKTDKELVSLFDTASFMSPISGTINVALPDTLRVHWNIFNSNIGKSWVLDDDAFDRKIGRVINYIASAVNNLDEDAINKIRDKSEYPALGDWGMDMGSDPTSTLRFDWREYLTKYANTDIKE